MNSHLQVTVWAILYSSDDIEIARYPVIGSSKIGDLLITWAINHHNIEYVKLMTN
jgi:hypothetical protein